HGLGEPADRRGGRRLWSVPRLADHHARARARPVAGQQRDSGGADMLVLIRSRFALLVALAALMTAALPGQAGSARAVTSGKGSGSCYPVNLTWICVYSGISGGDPGSGGGSPIITCTFTKSPRDVLRRTGTGPPAPGYQWDIMTC